MKEGDADLVQIVVLANELLQLRLNIDNLRCWKFELDHGHTCFLQVFQEPNLGGLQEHQAAALAVGSTGRSSDTVDVIAGIIRRVELDDPIDGRDLKRKLENGQSSDIWNGMTNIQATSSNISTDEGTLGGIAELEEGVGAFLLLLLSVKLQNRQVNVV